MPIYIKQIIVEIYYLNKNKTLAFMESNNTNNSRKHTFTYIFKHSCEKVFHIIRDWCFFQQILQGKLKNSPYQEFEMLKGSLTWEVNSEFSVLSRDLKAYFRTIEYFEDNNNSKIQWQIYKTEPETFQYDLTCSLFSEITNTHTTLILEWEYNENAQFYIDHSKISQERQSIFVIIDEYLNNENKVSKQKQSIIINSSYEKTKNVLANLKDLAS